MYQNCNKPVLIDVRDADWGLDFAKTKQAKVRRCWNFMENHHAKDGAKGFWNSGLIKVVSNQNIQILKRSKGHSSHNNELKMVTAWE